MNVRNPKNRLEIKDNFENKRTKRLKRTNEMGRLRMMNEQNKKGLTYPSWPWYWDLIII